MTVRRARFGRPVTNAAVPASHLRRHHLPDLAGRSIVEGARSAVGPRRGQSGAHRLVPSADRDRSERGGSDTDRAIDTT